MTLLHFQFIIIITVTIQVAVLNQFSWNSRGWCRSTHEWTTFFLETIGMDGNVSQNWFSGFYSAGMRVLRKKISKLYSVPHLPQKGYIHFCRPTPHSLKKLMPPKNYSLPLFWKILLFFFGRKVPLTNLNVYFTNEKFS